SRNCCRIGGNRKRTSRRTHSHTRKTLTATTAAVVNVCSPCVYAVGAFSLPCRPLLFEEICMGLWQHVWQANHDAGSERTLLKCEAAAVALAVSTTIIRTRSPIGA